MHTAIEEDMDNIIAMPQPVDCTALWEALRQRCTTVAERVRLDIRIAEMEGRMQP